MAESDPAPRVEVEETDDPVQAGEELTVTAAVENTGDEAGEFEVTLVDPDGEELDSASEIALEPGEREAVDLSWTPAGESIGEVELVVQSGDDDATATVTVEDAPAAFTVDVAVADEHVPPGAIAAVTATVENTGTLEGSKALEIAVDGERAEARTLSLAGGETETVEYTHRITEDDHPEATVSVESDADSDEATIAVVTESVTPARPVQSKGGMGLFGWAMFLGMVVLLVPLLPIIALFKLVDVLRRRGTPAE